MLNLLSCDSRKSLNYSFTELFRYENIDKDQEIKHIYILNDSVGILLGEDRRNSEPNTANYPSVILNSNDGGASFTRQTLGNGELIYLSQSSNHGAIYVVQLVCDEKTGKVKHSLIFCSKDEGNTWEQLCMFKDKVVDCVLFHDDKHGIVTAIGDYTEQRFMYTTEDAGKSWALLDNPDLADKECSVITQDGYILGTVLSNDSAYWKMDIRNCKLETIELAIPDNYIIDSPIRINPISQAPFVAIREKEWSDGSRFMLYDLLSGDMLDVDFPIGEFSVYGDYISIVSWERGNSLKSLYYYSRDMGKTWRKEIPPCSVLSQYALYGKGHFWGIAETGDSTLWALMVRKYAV